MVKLACHAFGILVGVGMEVPLEGGLASCRGEGGRPTSPAGGGGQHHPRGGGANITSGGGAADVKNHFILFFEAYPNVNKTF